MPAAQSQAEPPTEPPFVPLTADLTPGAYMRRCRTAARVTVAQAAATVALRGCDRLRAQDAIRALEANRPGDYSQIVSALRDRAAFPFDFGLFASLAAETADPSMSDVIRW